MSPACLNCGAPLAGRFCASCGQKASSPNPSISDFLHELAHEVLHVDGKIVQTLRLLVVRPGALTREQFAGRRSRYVPPIRLYLTLSVLYFALAALTPGINFRVTVGASNQHGFSMVRPEDRRSNPDDLRRLGYESQEALEHAAGEAIVHWTPRVLFLLVPIFAAMVGVTVRRSGRNYPQQLYFALHVHAAWFLMLSIASLLRFVPWRPAAAVIPLALVAWILIYVVLALRRAYDLKIAAATWRAIAVCSAYALLLGVAMGSILLPVLLIGRR
jgi:hypothetical protein